MADTKRGRERKGRVKEQQMTEYEVQQELELRGEEFDFEELYEDEEIEVLSDD